MTSISQELIDGDYQWRARAIDNSGAMSDFSGYVDFSVTLPQPEDGCCDVQESCSAGGDHGPGAMLGVGLGLVALARRRRRR